MNMQVGCPDVHSKGCLKFKVELGVKSTTGQTRVQGWEPGAALFLLPDFIRKHGRICISCISAWPVESLYECIVGKLKDRT